MRHIQLRQILSTKVSESLDAAEATLKEYMGDDPTCHEKVVHDCIKTARTSLVNEKEKVEHMMRYNKRLQYLVRVLQQKVREQTALLRAHRVKWYSCCYVKMSQVK